MQIKYEVEWESMSGESQAAVVEVGLATRLHFQLGADRDGLRHRVLSTEHKRRHPSR